MSIDLTAALEERRRAHPPRTLTLFDDTFTLPHSMSAAAALELLRIEERGVTKVDNNDLDRLGQELLGPDQWNRLMRLIQLDELPIVVDALMGEVMGAPADGDSIEDGEGLGEA